MVRSTSIDTAPEQWPAAEGLFTALVDDAGLFPPEELPMGEAAARHRLDDSLGSPVLSHHFVCPAPRLAELRGVLVDGDRFALSVISALEPAAVQGVLSTVESDARLSLVGLEGVLPPGWFDDGEPVIAALRQLPAGLPAFVEVPIRGDISSAVTLVTANGWSVKLRCGGVRADLFPSVEQLAAAIVACTGAGVAFKATAGLHHAVRYRDPATGFVHHGFLNILLAAARAAAGRSRGAVEEVLNVTDAIELSSEAVNLDATAAARARAAFVSYGSCSTSDPIADLSGLGLLRDPAVT